MKTFAEHWNGARWSVVTTPSPNAQAELFSVSCPTAGNCYAVGNSSTPTTTKTLVEHWDGTRWSIVTSPNPTGAAAASLNEVSCSTTSSCVAVGYSSTTFLGFGTTLVERLMGR